MQSGSVGFDDLLLTVNRDFHFTDAAKLERHDVSRLHWLDTLTGAGHDDIARIKRIDARCPRNLAGNANDHLACVRGLANIVADAQREVKLHRINDPVGRRTSHGPKIA